MTKPNPVEAEQVCATCLSAITHGSNRLGAVPGLIKRILTEDLWRERKVPGGKIVQLRSFRDLVTLKPFDGWGEDPTKIEKLIQDDPEALTLWREAMKEQGHNQYTSKHYNVMEAKQQGTSRAYTLSRLKSQHPELFEQVKAGKLSANRAAIKAGFRRQPTPLEQLKKLWLKATPKDRKNFQKWCKNNVFKNTKETK